MKIAIKDLRPNPIWHGERESINALSENIKALGGQPIQKPIARKKDGQYEIICGWRRVLASKQMGAIEIDCEITKINDSMAAMMLLSENLFRSNLDDVTKGEICLKIHELEIGSTSTKKSILSTVAPILGVDKKAVWNWLQTLNLPDDVQKEVKSKRVSGEVARSAYRMGGKKAVKKATEKKVSPGQIKKAEKELREVKDQYGKDSKEYKTVKKEIKSGKVITLDSPKERAETIHVKQLFDKLEKDFGLPDIHQLTTDDIIPNIERVGGYFKMLLDNQDIFKELMTDQKLCLKLRASWKAISETAKALLNKI